MLCLIRFRTSRCQLLEAAPPNRCNNISFQSRASSRAACHIAEARPAMSMPLLSPLSSAPRVEWSHSRADTAGARSRPPFVAFAEQDTIPAVCSTSILFRKHHDGAVACTRPLCRA